MNRGWRIVAALAVTRTVGYGVLCNTFLVAALRTRGHPATFAAATAGLLGLLSVTGRLATTAMQRSRPAANVVAAVFAVRAIVVATLPVVGHHTIAAVVARARRWLSRGSRPWSGTAGPSWPSTPAAR